MAAWMFLALAFAPAAAEPAPTLTLVWLDSARLLPSVAVDLLGDEMETLFRENGLSVRFHAAEENEDLRTIPEPRVHAIVLPGEDRRFGLPKDAMAATLGERGEKHSIFIFYPRVRRALGHRDLGNSPRRVAELSRALARIVAHEVVHALAPERGHAESGLMSGKLTRQELLSKGIDLDGPSLERAAAALKEWSATPLTGSSKFPIPAGPLRSIVQPEVKPTCPSAK